MVRRFSLFVVAVTLFAPAGIAGAARSNNVAHPEAGRDISFPQCGAPLPRIDAAAFGVLGVNGGASFTRNPCLVAELRWAKKLSGPPAFYLNTGNPGPARSRHWPIGQQTPRVCRASNPNSLGCSLDYGWNAAVDSFSNAVGAAQQLHHVAREDARRRVRNVDWWLDVEILNSWQKPQQNTATLLGAVQSLWNLGVDRVGIYSTGYQWNRITGGPRVTHDWFRANPVWLAGFADHAHARGGCARPTFTGGPVLMTQYLGADGFDSNVWCA